MVIQEYNFSFRHYTESFGLEILYQIFSKNKIGLRAWKFGKGIETSLSLVRTSSPQPQISSSYIVARAKTEKKCTTMFSFTKPIREIYHCALLDGKSQAKMQVLPKQRDLSQFLSFLAR